MTSDRPTIDRRTVLKTATGAGAAALAGGGAFLALTGSAAASATLNVTVGDTQIANDAGHLNYVGVDVDKTITWEGYDVPVKYIGFKHEVAADSNSEGWHQLYPTPGAADDPDGFAVSPELPDWSNYGDDEAVTSYTTDANDYPEGTTGEAVAGVAWEIINDTGEPGSYAGFGYDGGGPQDPAEWASELSEGEDGAVNETTVQFKSTLRFYEGIEDGDYIQISGDDGIGEVDGEDSFLVTVTNENGTTSGSTEDGTSDSG